MKMEQNDFILQIKDLSVSQEEKKLFSDFSLVSEREIPLIQTEHTIENNGSKEDLFEKVCELTKNILGQV